MRWVQVFIDMRDVLARRGRDQIQQLYLARLKIAGAPVELGLDRQLHLDKGTLTVEPDSKSYRIMVTWVL